MEEEKDYLKIAIKDEINDTELNDDIEMSQCGLKEEYSDKKLFKCSICDMAFSEKSKLKIISLIYFL